MVLGILSFGIFAYIYIYSLPTGLATKEASANQIRKHNISRCTDTAVAIRSYRLMPTTSKRSRSYRLMPNTSKQSATSTTFRSV